VPESVKVLTVYVCACGHVGLDPAESHKDHLAPVECLQQRVKVSYVPQAELDRLRAVGEEMATELEYQRDLRVQQLGGIPDERAVLRELVEMHIRRIDARLKSYREAVPE
jgi:hypothetical protein